MLFVFNGGMDLFDLYPCSSLYTAIMPLLHPYLSAHERRDIGVIAA
ncbi:hypothetical protein [Chitinophaga sp. YR627]|nr:hypothetical protein [Chitinophaga sp. YR627]